MLSMHNVFCLCCGPAASIGVAPHDDSIAGSGIGVIWPRSLGGTLEMVILWQSKMFTVPETCCVEARRTSLLSYAVYRYASPSDGL